MRLITLKFSCEGFGTCSRDLIIDAPLVVHFRIYTLVALPNQAGIEHAFE